MPSRLTTPFIHCQMINGLDDGGGLRKPSASESAASERQTNRSPAIRQIVNESRITPNERRNIRESAASLFIAADVRLVRVIDCHPSKTMRRDAHGLTADIWM